MGESQVIADKAQVARADLGGKYLTFVLAKESYGLEILKVREIIGMMDITPVPKTPAYVKGVINLRGRIIPVVDLRSKFRIEAAATTPQSCIIVVDIRRELDAIQMGVTVDEVSDVINILNEQVDPAPEFGEEVDTDFILGLGKVDQKVVILLDADKVLNEVETSEITSVGQVAASNAA